VRRLSWANAFLLPVVALFLTTDPTIGAAAITIPTGASAAAAGPVLEAKIASGLSSRNAKTGDEVKAKTLKAYKLADGTELPKGSTLIGKVALARSKKEGNGKSMLTFRFDQVESKGGAVVPVHGLVVAIGPELAPKNLFGAKSILQGGGSSPIASGIDPAMQHESGGAMDEDDIPMGSTLPDVALGRHMDADWTTALEGIKTEIDLNSDVVVKVQLR